MGDCFGNHRHPHSIPKPFDHCLNTPGASHPSMWETWRNKWKIYFQEAIAKETPDYGRQDIFFKDTRERSMYSYPPESNVSVMFSCQHSYIPPRQQTYMHTTHCNTKPHFIICMLELNKTLYRINVIPFNIFMNIYITCYQTWISLYNFSVMFSIILLYLGNCQCRWCIQWSWHLRVNHYGMYPDVSYPASGSSPLLIYWGRICWISYYSF